MNHWDLADWAVEHLDYPPMDGNPLCPWRYHRYATHSVYAVVDITSSERAMMEQPGFVWAVKKFASNMARRIDREIEESWMGPKK